MSHNTTLETFRSIVTTKELRLYSVRKRIEEDELRRMLMELGFDGQHNIDPISGKPIFEGLSDDIFYTSLSENKDSDHLWTVFGDSHQGVRLDFRVEAYVEDFRAISYEPLTPLPLGRLVQRINNEVGGRKLLVRGVSKLCAFHLPNDYGIEEEKRLLLAKHSDTYSFPMSVQTDASDNSFVALPIGGTAAPHYTINLVGISAWSSLRFDVVQK